MSDTSFLIVDNNPAATKTLTDILNYLGYVDIQDAASANDAWAMLRVREFDCVFSAWEMPDMTGIALLKIVRYEDRLFSLPFFLAHSTFDKVKVIQAGQSGATGLIVTPFETEVIKDKIEQLSAIKKSLKPTESEKTLERGLKLIESDNHEEALELFQDLIKNEETPEYYYNIGYIKTAQEKFEEALLAFHKATKLDRLYAKAYEAMGRIYKKLDQPGEAEKFLKKAADIYMSKEKDQHAEDILNEILEISPDTVNVYNSLGVLSRRKGKFHEAVQHYRQALKIHPKEPHIHFNIGKLYIHMKEPEKAIPYLETALKLDPNFKFAKDALNAIKMGSV